MTLPFPLRVTSFQFRYDVIEDRIALDFDPLASGPLTLYLTRRLAERLLNDLAEVLTRSSIVARRAPASVRSEVVLMEHDGAVYAAPASNAVPAASVSGPPVQHAYLVTSVKVSVLPASFTVSLQSKAQDLIYFEAARDDMHRLLDLLKRTAAVARWAIHIEASWLSTTHATLRPN
jgi:hypothetical protein